MTPTPLVLRGAHDSSQKTSIGLCITGTDEPVHAQDISVRRNNVLSGFRVVFNISRRTGYILFHMCFFNLLLPHSGLTVAVHQVPVIGQLLQSM
jgi:hypothetical protein